MHYDKIAIITHSLLCARVSVWGVCLQGLCPGGLSGGLCPGMGGLCLGRVSVQGWGSLSGGGLCPGEGGVSVAEPPPPHPTGTHSCVMCERSLKLVA